MPATVAKFYCQTVTRRAYNPASVEVELSPVTRGEENRAWSAATPSGLIRMTVTNAAAAQLFELGKEYLVTFEPAETP